MQRIPFDRVLQLMNKSELTKKLSQASDAAIHIRIPEPSSKPFIEPDFNISDHDLMSEAQVLLISAPAAVGKTSLAKRLGRETGNLVWDLSRFSVGSSFFTGTLVNAYGTSGLDIVRTALGGGAATLILDAADEALVGSGSKNFQAALDDLSSLISGMSGAGPVVVILGRPDTIDDTVGFLSQRDIKTQVFQVAFFNEEQAREFVKAKAKKSDRSGIAVRELSDFLCQFFQIVKDALGAGEWSDSDSFLGYAPILEALGAFYRREENPIRRLNEISTGTSSNHVWDLLIEMIESVMDRDAEKFGKNFGGDDERKSEYGLHVYTRKNQLALLLGDVPADVEIDIPLDDDIEESWVFDELSPKIQAQYREHPFLNSEKEEPNPLLRFASVAFRDYAIAATISTGHSSDVSRLLDYWTDSRVAPSPMLSRFCMSSLLGAGEVSTDAVVMINDSHASGFQANVRLEIEVHDEWHEEEAFSTLEVVMLEDHQVTHKVSARLSASEPLRLARSVARTSISLPNRRVVTGSGFQGFSIGPDVSIECEQLDSESAEVRVRAGDARPNEIRVARVQGSTRRVSSPQPGGLRLSVPVAVFPWQAYKADTPEADPYSESAVYWAGMEIRRTTRWFARESMIGGLNYPASAMDLILRKGRASYQAHTFCSEKGYLRKINDILHLEFPGFSAKTVLDNNIEEPAYRNFLRDFIEWELKA